MLAAVVLTYELDDGPPGPVATTDGATAIGHAGDRERDRVPSGIG